jgi:hypothetical protein
VVCGLLSLLFLLVCCWYCGPFRGGMPVKEEVVTYDGGSFDSRDYMYQRRPQNNLFPVRFSSSGAQFQGGFR